MSETCIACGMVLSGEERFCPGCGNRTTPTCPRCDELYPAGANFCPNCGNALRDLPQPARNRRAQEQSVDDEIPPSPKSGIVIEFPVSASGSFEFALREAANHPTFTQHGTGKQAIHRVTFEPADLSSAIDLIGHMKGWRRKAVYVDGEKVTWASVFWWHRCHGERASSYRPEYYCFGHEQSWKFNLCGCLYSGFVFRERAPWTSWGQFLDKNGDWAFDKARILHEVEKSLHKVRFCPALNHDLARQAVMSLPDKVNPTKDKDWIFVETWGENPEGLVMVRKEYGFEQKVTMMGVGPNGYGAARKILRQVAPNLKNLPVPKN